MIMQMLEAGGVPILSDQLRQADEDNPKGYYELEAVKRTRYDAWWLKDAGGKAVKVISRLLGDLPADRRYKVILMRREMEELLASQRTMLARRGQEAGGGDDAELGRLFATHVEQVRIWLQAQANLEYLEIWYSEVLRDPTGAAAQIGLLLRRPLHVERMAAIVDARLYRHRRGQRANRVAGGKPR